MKSITIHKLETEVVQLIEQMAAQTGLSQNKVIKRLLRSSLGLDKAPEPPNDFEQFCGIWTAEDAAAFDAEITVFDQIEEELWH